MYLDIILVRELKVESRRAPLNLSQFCSSHRILCFPCYALPPLNLTIPTMAKYWCGKSAGWVAIILFSCLLNVIAQPEGFLSISCGAERNHTDENHITWVPDKNYIGDVGQPGYIGDVSQEALGSYIQYLRSFPQPLNKSCYELPVAPNVPYLLRLWFAVGNYTGFRNSSILAFAFSIETPGLLFVQNIPTKNLTNLYPFNYEQVLVSSGRVLYICLIRTSKNNDPFISSIELRTLRDGMYQQAKPGTLLSLETRLDLGGNSSVRYPRDEFDRLWEFLPVQPGIQPVSLKESISTNNTQDLPPSVVMQTAWIASTNSLAFSLPGGDNTTLVVLYFADIGPVNMTLKVSINGQEIPKAITMTQNYSALQAEVVVNDTVEGYYIDMELSALTNSTRLIINAVEIYGLVDTQPATYSKDIEALEALKVMFGIKDWISDPCYLIPWKGIRCVNISSVVSISEIKLSAMNLRGAVPANIAELTALVSLSLEDNHLTGTLPNFSSLIMLEKLHLQNNNLTGTVPEWLCGLENLQELYIENNNFSGVIPACLSKTSMNFRYSGNSYLDIPSNTDNLDIPSNTDNQRLKLILGMTLSGSAVILLVLTVGIVVHRKKSRIKKGRRGLYEDNSMIEVPNTTKSRAFTLEEIMAATQNFSQKIGEGGFGSVFFGKLEQGENIAVKVLSLFSKQGVQEFLNEINLLSTVHHKNLVSLLGYCNESRELMLVYEHMYGGSLRQRLYGPTSLQLNWKTRLKIALDAAQGLEYLHAGCIPKIVHRDVKTANILLDHNMNGKIADFGLSRLTSGGEASHVTTIVKGTPGYLDPAYFRTQMLTEKSDVYSFGVVLLELICGRSPIKANLAEDELDLVQWVTQHVEMDEIAVIVDERFVGNYDMKSVADVAKLALRCVHGRPSYRPSASDVVAEIKSASEVFAAIKSPIMHDSYLPNSEMEIGPICSRVDDMKWSDNSSNLHHVGR